MFKERSTTQMDACSVALSADEYGWGAAAGDHGDQLGDDASGRFWLVTDDTVRLALRVSLATGRPLLVRGVPGTGKSTLARAVAATLGWRYLGFTVTSRTEAADLLWTVDHLSRLRDAQLGAKHHDRVDDELNYVRPGPIWQALSPSTTSKLPSHPARAEDGDRAAPAVILIDEIDKADPEMPDNLLEVLGWLRFTGPGATGVIEPPSGDLVPLVIITSNNERDLSPAFMRRCVKVSLGLPDPPTLERIALGHLPSGDRSIVAVAVAKAIMPADGVTAAAFVDAARAARAFSLTVDSEQLQTIRELLLDDGTTDG